MKDEILLIVVHLLGLLVGWYCGRQSTWLRAYKHGLAYSREIWMHAHDEAHAVLVQNAALERSRMLDAVKEHMRSAANDNDKENTPIH